jgi:hypothetical protein
MIERLLDAAELWVSLDDRIDARRLSWLREAASDVAGEPAAIRTLFPTVGRNVGREPLDPAADPGDVHAWTIDDAARAVLLVELGPTIDAELDDLYRYGDAAERRGILRALPYLPIEDRAIGVVEDAIRSNDTRLIAAALGPYATWYLDDAAYDQATLKCVFCEVPIAPLDGLPGRATEDGARMLAAFVHERIAAGRDVPGEVWAVIDRHPPEAELRSIESELESPFDDRRRAAERALASRHPRDPFTTTREAA